MEEFYEGHGVRFGYPAYWELTEQGKDEEAISIPRVASPETSFWSISLFQDGPPPQQVLDSAVEGLPRVNMRMEGRRVRLGVLGRTGQRAGIVARDLDFVCFELINSAFLRAFQTERFTVLVLYQGFDGELEMTRPLLEAISASLTFAGEDEA